MSFSRPWPLYADLTLSLDTSGSRLKVMDAQIARQRQQIEAVMAALGTVPGSKALGARLATEEAKLAQLEAERAALTDQRPKVMPHAALIARYVEDLLTTLDTDVPKARAILTRPTPLHPHARRLQLQNLRSPQPFGCRGPRSL